MPVNKSGLTLADQDELTRLRKEIDQLRRARDIKNGRRLLCERSRLKYGFIQAQQKTYPVTMLCRVMQVSTSAYYGWLKAPQADDKDQRDQKMAEKAKQIFIDNRRVAIFAERFFRASC